MANLKIAKGTVTLIEEAGIAAKLDDTGMVVFYDAEDEDRIYLVTAKATKEEAEKAIASKEADDGTTKSVVGADYKERYKAFGGSCGDDLSELLKAATVGAGGKCDPAELRLVAEVNGICDRLDGYEAKELNVGMCRMNIGNVLRGMLKKGVDVTIDGKTIAGEELAL